MDPFPCRMIVRPATQDDVLFCKAVAEQHRNAFGFLPRAVFLEAAERGQLQVVERHTGEVIGFIRYNHRKRGSESIIYDIAVSTTSQKCGAGRALISALAAECKALGRTSIVLRCPTDLPANAFYRRTGFTHEGVEPGRRRTLAVWRLVLDGEVCSS